jgi:hypothetical protein
MLLFVEPLVVSVAFLDSCARGVVMWMVSHFGQLKFPPLSALFAIVALIRNRESMRNERYKKDETAAHQ